MTERQVSRPEKRELDPAQLDHQSVYKIMAGCIVPRPIGFISTVDGAGTFNAAPFSFFNMVSHIPPMVSVSIARNRAGDGPKDTLANILAGGDFVVNIVTEDIVEAVDRCSEFQPPEIDEIALCGLTAHASTSVKSPRIGESPVNFECKLVSRVDLPAALHALVVGRVVRMHVRDDILQPSHRIDQQRLAAVGRMAGSTYCRTRDMFSTAHDGFAAVAALSNASGKSIDEIS
jgi:flavin reductase (DIM6/NTAB) family NADH-FMN oxidoreductase RutF